MRVMPACSRVLHTFLLSLAEAGPEVRARPARPTAAPRAFTALRDLQGLPGQAEGLCVRATRAPAGTDHPGARCLLLMAEGGAVFTPQEVPVLMTETSSFVTVLFLPSWKVVGLYISGLCNFRQVATFRSVIVQPRGSFPEHTGLGVCICRRAEPPTCPLAGVTPRACGSVLSGLFSLPVACVSRHVVRIAKLLPSGRLAFSPQSHVGPAGILCSARYPKKPALPGRPHWPLGLSCLSECPV